MRFMKALKAFKRRTLQSDFLAIAFTSIILGLESFVYCQSAFGFGVDYLYGVQSAGGRLGIGGSSTQACSRLLGFIEGGFGALVATAAGIGVIIAAAAGGFRTAWCLLVVSVGCFILRSYLTLFHAGCRT